MPAGAMPVPESNGTRELANWLFHYHSYEAEQKYREVPVTESVVPPSDATAFDVEMLEKLGLPAERMKGATSRTTR